MLYLEVSEIFNDYVLCFEYIRMCYALVQWFLFEIIDSWKLHTGDVSAIKIGNGVTVGDRAMIHSSGQIASIGDRVLIGAGANIHGCTLADECKVGHMATVLDKATVQKHAIVADGAVVTPGTTVKSRELWSGNPAKFERELTSKEIAQMAFEVADNVELSVAHAEENAKDWRQIEEEEEIREEESQRNPFYYQRLSEDVSVFFKIECWIV